MRLIRDLRKEGNLEIGTTVTMQPPDWLASKALQNTGQTLYYIILYYIIFIFPRLINMVTVRTVRGIMQ